MEYFAHFTQPLLIMGSKLGDSNPTDCLYIFLLLRILLTQVNEFEAFV